MVKDYDYIILGAGIAGIYLSQTLARKHKVALVEKGVLGGTAIRTGAVPVKKLLDIFKDGRENVEVKSEILENWEEDLSRLDSMVLSKLESDNIEVYIGDGEFLSSREFKVGETTLIADSIIIATGTSPKSIDSIKLDHINILSHQDILRLKREEKDIVVFGGNVEGVEIANFLQLFSNNVVLVEREEYILHEKDRDLVIPIENEFKRLGGRIITNTNVMSTSVKDKRVYTRLSSGEVLESDLGVLTFYREANIPKGIENTKLTLENGFIKVDRGFKTDDEHIYAIGDVNGIHGMAHVSRDEARILSEFFLSGRKVKYDYKLVPGAFFTTPEYAGVGYCEKDLNHPYKLGQVELSETFRGWAKDYKEGFIKAILDENNKILGIHMVGKNVSEYLGFSPYFIGKNAEEILDILVIHPSFSEGIKIAIERAMYGDDY